jgi:competence protein ComEA
MKECPERFVLWLLMLAVSVFLLFQGHPASVSTERVAFLPGSGAGPGKIMARFDGNCIKSGIYQFDSDLSAGTVINMTVPFLRENPTDQGTPVKYLNNGDLVSMTCENVQHIEITKDGLPVVEKMILGIPLNPNNLSAEEWEMLPRIGPSLASRIILDRQKNGEFRSIQELVRVSGVGSATLKHVERYFMQ